MVSDAPRTVPPPVELAPAFLLYLAGQCMDRPLIHGLVMADVHRWPQMMGREREAAVERAVRRVGAVCPWAVATDSLFYGIGG